VGAGCWSSEVCFSGLFFFFFEEIKAFIMEYYGRDKRYPTMSSYSNIEISVQ